MSALPPLSVALPLLVAAALAAVGGHLPRPALHATAAATALATAVVTAVQVRASWPHDLVHWFGGWLPHHGVAVGIVFQVDPLGGGLAAVAGVLAVAALTFSWQALPEVSHLYHVLMLVFLAGLCGFAVSGDLFDMFVFFELMSVTGYGLCTFRNTSSTVVGGALNFAVVNSIGAFFILMGIALVYGRTGALNLAQIAVALHGRRPDELVVVSFVFILVGFLTKAGAVPFHFWMSDAYAVAAAPVGVLYAGIMSDLAYHAIARVYAHAFAGSLAPGGVRTLLLGVGAVSALVGGIMAFTQSDLKRQLSFLVVAHGGVFLSGVALLDPAGVAGSTLYVAADAMEKGALFLAVGYVTVTLGASDELLLRGRGRHRRHLLAGAVILLAAAGLAAIPGTGPFTGAALIVTAAGREGAGWLPPLLGLATALAAAALLRSGLRVFAGWGPAQDPLLTSNQPDEPEEGEPREEERDGGPSPWTLAPAVLLLVLGYGLSAVPHLAPDALHAARSFLDLPGTVAEVLHGATPPAPGRLPPFVPGAGAWVYGAATAAGSLLLAAAGLWWQRVAGARRLAQRVVLPPLRVLKGLHSGRVGDMAAWLSFGAMALCAAGTVLLR